MSDHAVIWHDLECHAYAADLPLWHELAARSGGPVLEVGAGTGRVALDLAAAGHEVVALDSDPVLLAELSARAARRGLTVATVCADACTLNVTSSTHTVPGVTLTGFGAVIVPMQTVQLLADRAGFLEGAKRALRPGGLLALAIAEELEPFDAGEGRGWLPDPDVGRSDGWEFASQPTAIRVNGQTASIERIREATAPDGSVTALPSTIVLTLLTGPQLEAETAVHGFTAEPRECVPSTDLHVGSTVVMLRA